MSVVLANSYNENSASTIRDYSVSKIDGVGANMSMVADTFGYYADFDGSTSKIDTATVALGDSFTVFAEFYPDTVTGDRTIYSKEDHSRLVVDGNRLTFTVDNGVTSQGIVTIVSASTWYKVCCTYDGTTMNIYVDNNTVSATIAPSITGLSDANAFEFGNLGGANYYDGRLREIRFYDNTLDAVAVGALMGGQQGIKVTVSAHTYNVGDLIIQSDKQGLESHAVVFATETTSYRVLPMNDLPMRKGLATVRCGHRWDTDRQHFFKLDGSGSSAEIAIFDGVDLHTDLAADTTKKIIVNKDGIYKNAITKTANYTVTNKDLRLYVDSSGGAFTLTLPSSPTTNKELEIIDSVGSCSTYNVTINGNGNNIIGSSTLVMSTDYEGFHLSWNGTQWNLG